MKVTLHIPTEQYGYIEFEREINDGEGSLAAAEYKSVAEAARKDAGTNVGIPDKEFNGIYDSYRTTGSFGLGADVFATMSEKQQTELQALRRSLARTNNK